MKKALLALAVITALGAGSAELFARSGGGPGRGGRGTCDGQGYAQGQGQRGGGFHGIRNLEFLKDEIGLSDDQIKKIITIDSEYRLKYYENRNSITKINSLRNEHKSAVDNVFTAEQKKKLDEYWNNNRRGPNRNDSYGRGNGNGSGKGRK
ncbi:MAG: hypothetical protein JW864_01425 [Spirochaetes bacterium]|nr:hypothetical protein [Spirochaetota bacterium]